MTSVKRIEAGQYSVSDGRFIVKHGSSWYVLKSDGTIDFGPLSTLATEKEFVTEGITSVGNHNFHPSMTVGRVKKSLMLI
ncbi:hypothetical protein [Shewanella yunxiaonensis]|uniref:hypothetical protein n=1 Tax=Shewanella yunxiaonensis TaxID=2829809 RepID=UPI001E39DAF2|nr:hypothetical protein [Shewanella yunxiaonensis]